MFLGSNPRVHVESQESGTVDELYVAMSSHELNLLVMRRLVKRQERTDAKAAKRQHRAEANKARKASAAGGWWPGLRQRHASNGSHPAHPDAITNADLKSVAQKPAKPRDDTADFGAPLLQYFFLSWSNRGLKLCWQHGLTGGILAAARQLVSSIEAKQTSEICMSLTAASLPEHSNVMPCVKVVVIIKCSSKISLHTGQS